MPRVFVVPFQTAGTDSPGLIGHRITDLLQQNLGFRSGSLGLVTEQSLAAEAAYTGGPGQTAMRLEVARQKVRMAGDLIKTHKYQEAVVELNTASLLYEKNLPYIDDYGELLDVFLHLATAGNRMNNEQLENESLSLAIRMEPNLDVAARGFPALMRSTQRIKALQAQLPTGNLRITSSPSTATVFINGKERGQTPVEIPGLPMGDHFVRVVRPNSGVWSMKVQTLPGNNNVEVRMPPPGQVVGPDIQVEVDELGIDSVMDKLATLLSRGYADASLKNAALDATIRTNTSHLVLGYLAQTDGGYTVQPILYSAAYKQAVYLSLLELDSFMTNVTAQANMLTEEIVGAIKQWPSNRDMYVPDMSAPPPWVVAALNPTPAPAPPAPATRGPVASAQPDPTSYGPSAPEPIGPAPGQTPRQAPPRWQEPAPAPPEPEAPALPAIYGPSSGAQASGPTPYQDQQAATWQQPQPQPHPQQGPQLGSPWGEVPQRHGPAPAPAPTTGRHRGKTPPAGSPEYAILTWAGVDVGPIPPWAAPAIGPADGSGAMAGGGMYDSGHGAWGSQAAYSSHQGGENPVAAWFSRSTNAPEWYKRWYIWAAGVVLVGGATTAAVLLAGQSADTGASSVSIQW